MKLMSFFKLAIVILVLFLAQPMMFAKVLNTDCNAVSSLIYNNNFISGDTATTLKGTAKEKFKNKSLDLIRKQNEKNIVKMLHNRKYFYSGRRRVVAYAGMPYDSHGKPKVGEIISKLNDLGVNCYSYLIDSHSKEELSSLPSFCALALKSGIEVWVVLVPPSEEPGHPGLPDTLRYPPYGLNYVKWARDVSSISKDYKNLTLLMIDDFAYNMNYLTPKYMKEISASMKTVSHNLLLGVTIYEDQLKMKKFNFKPYKKFINAVEWGYQHNAVLSPQYGITAASLPVNINNFRKAFPNTLLIPCLYFTPHSSWKRKATEAYLNEAMTIAYQDAGVVLIFRTPVPGSVNYNLVKDFCIEHRITQK
ncbi:MAG: hypothetical protein M1480_17865 [Bacteroidetes bacterium]|nr:hypothetical protein [Bacteroidota bacterium]